MRILYVEPFDGGSHARFTQALLRGLEAEWTVLTLPGRHWKWRMRGSAAWFAGELERRGSAAFDLVVASSFLPLAEFVGMVPSLARVPRVLYFHENQLAYPVREAHASPRDEHFGFTQLTSALAADRSLFNSAYNRDSFLEGGRRLLARLPDAVPPGWIERLGSRAVVLPVPLDLPPVPAGGRRDDPPGPARDGGPILLWNHRWEHDKDPEAFFEALDRLAARDVPFRVAVCGERFSDAPPVFEAARTRLGRRVVHWGWIDSRDDYHDLLARCHVAVSTARQEFFGLSVLEAVHFGARPLVPDRLAYPEHFGPEFRHPGDPATLAAALEPLCREWTSGRIDLRATRPVPYLAPDVLPAYANLFAAVAEART